MLEGTLESFTLPDIFQLLSLTKKTGCLVLHDGDETGRVYFDDGQVYYALSTSGRLALGRRLVGAGMVSTEALTGALESQQQLREDGRGLRLGQILLEQGAIDEDTLETFVREQVQDAVFDLMRWQQGAFSFDDRSEDARVTEPIRLSVSVENLIMEGSRRLDEWEQVRRKIPAMDATVAMASMPGDTGVEVSLKPEEWRLLTVIDGRRTVQDLVDLFGQGEFQTCKVLYGMVGAGLLEVRDPASGGASSVSMLLQQQELLDALELDLPPRRDGAAEPTGRGDEPSPPAFDEPDPTSSWDDEPTPATDEDGTGSERDDDAPVDQGDDAEASLDEDGSGEDGADGVIAEADDEVAPEQTDEPSGPDEVELELDAVADQVDEIEDRIDDRTETDVADEAPDDELAEPVEDPATEPAEDVAEDAEPHDARQDDAPDEEEELLPPGGKRLSTDPSIDADLVRRLIDGVKGL